jgi:Ca2+-binding EF-hand superfamily protein
LTELASRVPEPFFEDLKMAFSLNDREKSGRLPYEVFLKCLKVGNMNATQREMDVLVAELDKDKKGWVEYEEFSNCCYLSYLFAKELKLRLICEQYDQAKAGTIKLSHLREIISSEEINLSSEQLDKIFTKELGVDIASIDQNDIIDYNLFLNCLRREFKLE